MIRFLCFFGVVPLIFTAACCVFANTNSNNVETSFKPVSTSSAVSANITTISKEEVILELIQNIKNKKKYSEVNIDIKNPGIFNQINKSAKTFSAELENKELLGLVIIPLSFYNDKNLMVDKKELVLKIDAFSNLVVTKRSLKPKEIIKADDLELSYGKLNDKPQNIILNISDAINKETKYNIQKGDLLLKSMIQETPLIRKGDKISIIFFNNSIKLEVEGNALEDGYYGKTIQVQKRAPYKIFEGEIIDSKKVLVFGAVN
ncbi:MAG: flagellar basal body P-ring formation chaperone FlgA [Candidatus Margulisiibacteriota bacterium]|jgi:flagella basal body P-ring formation protein FlgA